IVERIECLVNARKSQERHLIEFPKRSEDGETDLVGVELRYAGLTHRFFHLLCEDGKVGFGHRPTLTCLANPGDDLFAAEGLHHARAFDHVEAGRLRRAEAASALRTLPTTTDREPIVTGTGVDHTRIRVTAEGAVHGVSA